MQNRVEEPAVSYDLIQLDEFDNASQSDRTSRNNIPTEIRTTVIEPSYLDLRRRVSNGRFRDHHEISSNIEEISCRSDCK